MHTVGIQQGRKQLRGGAEPASVQVHAGNRRPLQEYGGGQVSRGGMGAEQEQQSGQQQPQGEPQHGGMPLIAFGKRFRGELEQRGSVHHHRNARAFRQRPHGVILADSEVPVDAIERPGLQFIHYLQAGDNDAVLPLDFLFQVPFGTVVHIAKRFGGIFQGRGEIAPAVSQAVDQGLRADIVTADGKLVGPALQGVFHVAVHHHVFRDAVQFHPSVRTGVYSFVDELVQDVEAVFDTEPHFCGGRLHVPAAAREERGGEYPHGCKQEDGAQPLQYVPFLIHDGTALPSGW